MQLGSHPRRPWGILCGTRVSVARRTFCCKARPYLDAPPGAIARRAHVCPRRAWTPKDRFSLTPIGLYGDLVRIAQQSISSWGDDQRRRETRMRGGLEEDAKGKEEAQKPVGGASTPMRPKDKYGMELALAA